MVSIDGVLLRASTPIPGASETLSLLQKQRIPFILLTNGGGKHEKERVSELGKRLDISLDPSIIVQSHTPFAGLVKEKNGQNALEHKCVMIVGGEGDKCRHVAEK